MDDRRKAELPAASHPHKEQSLRGWCRPIPPRRGSWAADRWTCQACNNRFVSLDRTSPPWQDPPGFSPTAPAAAAAATRTSPQRSVVFKKQQTDAGTSRSGTSMWTCPWRCPDGRVDRSPPCLRGKMPGPAFAYDTEQAARLHGPVPASGRPAGRHDGARTCRPDNERAWPKTQHPPRSGRQDTPTDAARVPKVRPWAVCPFDPNAWLSTRVIRSLPGGFPSKAGGNVRGAPPVVAVQGGHDGGVGTTQMESAGHSTCANGSCRSPRHSPSRVAKTTTGVRWINQGVTTRLALRPSSQRLLLAQGQPPLPPVYR
jgi:hypothetical protein